MNPGLSFPPATLSAPVAGPRRATMPARLALGAVLVGSGSAWAQDFGQRGPFDVGERVVRVTRDNGTTFTSLIYYPAVDPGVDTPIDNAEAPYPAVSFGHGFLQDPRRYAGTLEHLASWGFVVMASESAGGFFPDHREFADDLSQCLTWLTAEDADPQSWLHQAVDESALGLSGHSMGGGASLLAAGSDARIGAVANLAAAETNPSAVAAMRTVGAPVSLISGDSDGITPVENHGLRMFAAGLRPRQIPIIRGGFHCGFLDNNVLFCDTGGISRSEQLEITRRMLTEFFTLHLKDEVSLWDRVWGPGALSDPRVDITVEAEAGLTPDEPLIEAPAGGLAAAGLTIASTRPEEARFEILASAGGWAWSAEPAIVGPIASDGAARAEVIIEVPADAPVGEVRRVVLRARSLVDGSGAWGAVDIRVTAPEDCPPDLTNDGTVDGGDFLAFLAAFFGGEPRADFTRDGVVDGADFLSFLSAFFKGC